MRADSAPGPGSRESRRRGPLARGPAAFEEGFVLENGTVLDGTARPGRTADVTVKGDLVASIGPAGGSDDAQLPRIDCSGLYVTPGFVDIHSHSDFTLLVDPRAVSSVHQGVTLELVGNCGYGCFPLAALDSVGDSIYGYVPSFPIDWTTAAGYFSALERASPAVNVASLTPNAQLRRAGLAALGDRATTTDVARMSRALEQSLDEGSWGLSTGLEYASEASVTEDEVVGLLRPVREVGGLYATHTRDRNGDGTAGIAEAIRVAERSGVREQISHLLPRGGPEAGRACIGLVDGAVGRGADVHFDQHTRLFGFTVLSSVLPAWAFEGGTAQLAARLSDPETRRRLGRYSGLLGDRWTAVHIVNCDAAPELKGRSIAQLADESRKEPRDFVYDLLLASLDSLHSLTVEIRTYTRRQQEEVMLHERCVPASDATALAPDGPLGNSVFPGAYGWAAWFWRHFVTERKLLTPADAVARLSANPARRIGIEGRGVLRPGAFADIAVFDPDGFGDRDSLANPKALAVGMVHVFVNGVPTLLDGLPTGRRGGRVIRRGSTCTHGKGRG